MLMMRTSQAVLLLLLTGVGASLFGRDLLGRGVEAKDS
jgi:hypothetical protein